MPEVKIMFMRRVMLCVTNSWWSVCVCALIFKAAFSLPLTFPDSSAPFLRQAAFLSPAWNGMQRKCEMGGGWWRLGCVLNHSLTSALQTDRRTALGKIFYLHLYDDSELFFISSHLLFNLISSSQISSLLISFSHCLISCTIALFILSSCCCSRVLFSPCFV